MSDFAFRKGFDPKRGVAEGYTPGFDKHSNQALRNASYLSGRYEKNDPVRVRSNDDLDVLHSQGHVERHAGRNEVYLTAHARNLMNQMKS